MAEPVLPPATQRKLRTWSALWGVPELAESVEVAFSGLKASLGRCQPARLRDRDRAVLDEVVCHELAHVAVQRLLGPGAAPHGAEWKALVRAAGYSPSVQFAAWSQRCSTERWRP